MLLRGSCRFGWVTADEAYGQAGSFAVVAKEHDLAYVVAVLKSQVVICMDLGQRRAYTVIADLAETDWHRLSCGNGAHEQRLYDWPPWRSGRGANRDANCRCDTSTSYLPTKSSTWAGSLSDLTTQFPS